MRNGSLTRLDFDVSGYAGAGRRGRIADSLADVRASVLRLFVLFKKISLFAS